jgi:hypothetical protein
MGHIINSYAFRLGRGFRWGVGQAHRYKFERLNYVSFFFLLDSYIKNVINTKHLVSSSKLFFPRRNKVGYLRQRLFFRRKRLLQFRKISKFVYRYLLKRRRAVVLRNSVCNSIIRIRKLSFISSTSSKNFKRRKKRMGYTRLKFFKRPKKFRKEFMLFDKLPWIYIYFEPYVYPKYIFLNLVLYHEFAGSYQYGIRFRTGLFLLWNIFFNNFTGRLRFLKFTLVNRSLIFSRSHFLKNLTFYMIFEIF